LIAIASWFMPAQPNDNLICSVKHALFGYWKYKNKIIDYFLIYFIFKCLVDQHPHLTEEWNSTISFIEELENIKKILQFIN
jgi:predicted patatin/cPLA2 family phospholipase